MDVCEAQRKNTDRHTHRQLTEVSSVTLSPQTFSALVQQILCRKQYIKHTRQGIELDQMDITIYPSPLSASELCEIRGDQK